MSRHRRFTDGAGYTRHCWECAHARGWTRARTIDGWEATCELSGNVVCKHDSPNSPCCRVLGSACDYEEVGR